MNMFEIPILFPAHFLAPTEAQEIFVRPFGPNLSRAVNLHHSASNLQAISQE